MLFVLSLLLSSTPAEASAPDTGYWPEAFPCDGDPNCTMTSSMEDDLVDLLKVNTLHALAVFPGSADLDGILTNSEYIDAGLGRNSVCASGRVNGGVDCASLEESSLVTSVDRPTTGTCPRVGVGRYVAFAVCDGYLEGWGKNTSAVNSLIANAPTTSGWKNVDVASIGYTFALALANDNTVPVWAGMDGPLPDAIKYAPGWDQCKTSSTSRVYTLQYYENGACHPLTVRVMPEMNEYSVAHTFGLVVWDGGGVYDFGTPLIVGGSPTPTVVAETCGDIY